MNEGFADSQRVRVLKRLTSIFKESNGGRYYVRRGAINWSQFNFDQNQYAVSINCDESSFLRPGPQTMIISVEMMGKLPTETELVAGNIDDTGIDIFHEDVALAVGQLMESKQEGQGGDPGEDSVVLRIDQIHDKIVEMADLNRGIQGIIAFFIIDY